MNNSHQPMFNSMQNLVLFFRFSENRINFQGEVHGFANHGGSCTMFLKLGMIMVIGHLVLKILE